MGSGQAGYAAKFIVDDGESNAEIIVAEKPTRMQVFAAEELREYIKKLTGAEVPILREKGDAEVKIYVGKSEYTDKMGLDNSDLEHGAYRMVTGKNYLLLPGDFGEYLPEIKSIELPQNVNKTVRLDWDERVIGFYLNAPFMATPDEFKWQLRLGFSYDTKVSGGHGTDRLIKYNDYVKKNHPEFHAKYGDTRNTGKPCYSSEGLKKSAFGFASLMYDKYGKDVVSFMPVDGYTSFCQCNFCKGKDTP